MSASTGKVFFSTNPNKWLGRPASAQNVVPTSPCHLAFSPGQIRLLGGQINLAAAASGVGLAIALADSEWIAGSWTTATSTYADLTANAQSGTDDSFDPAVTTTTNNVFIVAAKRPFNVLGIDVTTADGGSTAVYDTAYWGYPTTGSQASAAGWQQITQANNFIHTTATFDTTGEKLIVANFPPAVMVATVAADVTGLPAGYYAFRMRATTAATTTACQFARIYAGVEILRQSQLAQHATLNLAGGTGSSVRIPAITGGVMVGAFFATTNVGNNLYLEYE